MSKIAKAISQLLQKPISLSSWAGSFLAIIILRVFIEQFLSRTITIDVYNIILEITHNLFFFLISILLIWLLVSFIIKKNLYETAPLFAWASLLILFPPLIDMVKTQGEVFWSFYMISSASELAGQFLTIFGQLPSGIVYFGTKIIFILTILLGAIFVYFQTKNIKKTLGALLGIYAILFIMGGFPSFFTLGYSLLFEPKNILDIKNFEIAQFFGTPSQIFGVKFYDIKYSFAYKLDLVYYPFLMLILMGLFFWISRPKFFSVLKNFRYPQIIYHSGLFISGLFLALISYPQNLTTDLFSWLAILVLLISIWLAWKTSVIVNDIYDQPIDEITNAWRPLPQKIFTRKEYWELGVVCFLLSLLGGIIIGFKFFALLFVYQLIAWFYSAPPFRLKRFPGVASFVSSLASLLVLFMGYILVSSDQNITSLSWRIILLLIIAYTISIPIKDFKDISGDKKYEVWTIPVIFGEKRGRMIIAINFFISYMLSVFFLNELDLFWWALLFGGATFLAVNSGKIKPRQLPGIVLGLVFVYGLILVKVVFS